MLNLNPTKWWPLHCAQGVRVQVGAGTKCLEQNMAWHGMDGGPVGGSNW